MKNCFFSLFLIFILHLPVFTIEVGGHITEDTVWSPANNPYFVTSVLYVDDDVTLFIEPGTQIYINSALFNNDTYVQDFAYHGNEEPTAKMFWVNGRIIAQGTEQDSILFTRIQKDSTYFKWGIIYLSESAELSRFKHCRFEHASTIVINLTSQPSGALAVHNSVIVDNCYFIDNRYGIASSYPDSNIKIEISNNYFTIDEGIDPNTTDWGRAIHLHSYENLANRIWVSNNEFHNRYCSFGELISVVDNKFYGNGFGIKSSLLPNYAYRNYFYNVESPIGASADEDESGIYIKNNVIEADSAFFCEGIRLYDYGYFEVTDNIVYGGIESSSNSSGKVFNNIIHNNPITNSCNGLELGGYFEIFNNIVKNCYTGLTVGWRVLSVNNNIIINNHYALGNLCFTGVYHYNSVFIGNENLVSWPFDDTLYVKNCIMDSISEDYTIAGENNLIINEDQIDSIFIDFAHDAFHLIDNSIAIDAGFDTLGYYYPFDLDYNHRVWDGNGNGTAIIDIGLYEYGAPSLGGIQGFTYNPDSGEIVDYVLLKINNQPGEFTFSDSVGSYEYKLPAGVYDVYAERVFYDDAVEYQIEVFDEEFTQLYIPMYVTAMDVEEHEIPHNSPHLSNYPNPFNPSTTISFELTAKYAKDAKILICNLKGQKVKVFTLPDRSLEKSEGSVVWNGRNENDKAVSSGIYFYQLRISDQPVASGKMLLMK
ncbi:MAG: hypothetical protein APR54_06105 [Candidatus Cloacimonas sp. SDB]|nr:MAG: hypothetical protein APR54_06105 [Candidatus Cloacimonas sp. SDB]